MNRCRSWIITKLWQEGAGKKPQHILEDSTEGSWAQPKSKFSPGSPLSLFASTPTMMKDKGFKLLTDGVKV